MCETLLKKPLILKLYLIVVNEKGIILCKKISRYQELNCKKIKTRGTKASLPNITAVLPLRKQCFFMYQHSKCHCHVACFITMIVI